MIFAIIKTGLAALAASATAPGQTGYRLIVRYEYTAFGHLKRVRQDVTGGVVYWEAQESDAVGHRLLEQLGNGVMTS